MRPVSRHRGSSPPHPASRRTTRFRGRLRSLRTRTRIRIRTRTQRRSKTRGRGLTPAPEPGREEAPVLIREPGRAREQVLEPGRGTGSGDGEKTPAPARGGSAHGQRDRHRYGTGTGTGAGGGEEKQMSPPVDGLLDRNPALHADVQRLRGTLIPAERIASAGTLSAVTERTLVLIKPDGVQRRLIGEVLGRIERKGLTIAALELATSATSWPASTTPSTTASRSSTRCWSSSPPDPSSRRSSRARGPLRPSGSSPAAPIRWRRPPPAPSAVTWHLSPRTTSCTGRIRRSRRPAKSSSGSPADSVRSSSLVRRRPAVWDTGYG